MVGGRIGRKGEYGGREGGIPEMPILGSLLSDSTRDGQGGSTIRQSSPDHFEICTSHIRR